MLGPEKGDSIVLQAPCVCIAAKNFEAFLYNNNQKPTIDPRQEKLPHLPTAGDTSNDFVRKSLDLPAPHKTAHENMKQALTPSKDFQT